ncbi:MAG: SMC-Scp complex subunit ScpB [Clostridia bacterium]|nr:SMC-Scp complex subunit ScpB [Clostridia bacterium]
MEIGRIKRIIEAILFATGRKVTEHELMLALEIPADKLKLIIQNMQDECKERGIDLIRVDDGYQLCTKKEYYEYIYPIIDKRNKPRLSGASLETLAIIAYNSPITRAEIESIRGVNSDASIYKLLEYGLIQEAGKLDLPGKPMAYKTTDEFLKMFGYSSLEDLPELPRYKLDENKQIVIDDLIEAEAEKEETETAIETEKKEKEKTAETETGTGTKTEIKAEVESNSQSEPENCDEINEERLTKNEELDN